MPIRSDFVWQSDGVAEFGLTDFDVLIVVHNSAQTPSSVSARLVDSIVDGCGGQRISVFKVEGIDELPRQLLENEHWVARRTPASPPEAGNGRRVVVERTLEKSISVEELRERERRGDWCLDMHNVRHLHTYYAADGSRMLCVYSAPDIESVRVAQRAIDLPITRIWGEAGEAAAQPAAAAESIQLIDTTLRDGLGDRDLTSAQKLRLLAVLDDVGFEAIEVGMTSANGRADEDLDRLVRAVTSTSVVVLSHPSPAAIDRACEALAATERGRLTVFNRTSDEISIRSCGRATDLGEAQLEAVDATVAHAVSRTVPVNWAALDATRAEPEFLARAVVTALRAGAETVTIPDTRGRALPHEIAALLDFVTKHDPSVSPHKLGVHFHNDLGLAVANVVTALRAGIRRVEGTLAGVGPHGGNTPLEAVAAAVDARKDAFEFRSGVDASAADAAAAEVRQLL